MNQMHPFALWITGIPASGKSTLARALADRLHRLSIPVAVLESDELRTILTPRPTYSEPERDFFYHALARLGSLLTRQGINVIFDATAHKRSYRDFAATLIQRFLEIHVSCPLDECMRRDPKGIYKMARTSPAAVPGLNIPYEPPIDPWFVTDTDTRSEENVLKILAKLHVEYPDVFIGKTV